MFTLDTIFNKETEIKRKKMQYMEFHFILLI